MALDCGPRGHRFDLAKGGLSQGRRGGGKGMGKHVKRIFSENMTIRSGYSSKMPRILPENSNYWGRGP